MQSKQVIFFSVENSKNRFLNHYDQPDDHLIWQKEFEQNKKHIN